MASGRLLALDDDPAIGHLVSAIAESVGMSAQSTTDPGEFFRLVESWDPSLITLDLIMPEMDGVQVIAELARKGCRAHIIISSGIGDRVLDAAKRSAAQHGLSIAGVLPKPFTLAQLRAILGTAGADAASPTIAAPATVALSAAGVDPAIAPHELEQALDRRELFVVYQPKITCARRSLAGFEALVRWRHPTRGVVAPDRFVPLAESCGLIDRLTDHVLDESLAWFGRHFVDAGPGATPPAAGKLPGTEPVTLSINISARTLGDEKLVERIVQRCKDLRVNPGRLVFELTETSAMEDPIASLDLLTRLRMQGFLLSLDDFGTGYSSMVQLVRLPFSEMKVDRSFVMTLQQSQESRAVVLSILGLARSLGLRCTAEGVEDEAALDFLTRNGCDLAQGYFIARPMDGDAALQWMSA